MAHSGQTTMLLCVHVAVILMIAVSAPALILHPGDTSGPADRPDDAVVGQWTGNASFVVIAPNWIISTQHQLTTPSTVEIAGTLYSLTYRNEWIGGPNATPSAPGSADVQLVRLEKRFPSDSFASRYTPICEGILPAETQVVLGGYGRVRGETLTITPPGGETVIYGYAWGVRNNEQLTWGTNRTAGYGSSGGDYPTIVVTSDFDDPESEDATAHEAAAAEFDSGAGWFVKQDSQWLLAGVIRGAERHGEGWPGGGESWFRDSETGEEDPDYNDAVGVGHPVYYTWISNILAETGIPGDTDHNTTVDATDLSTLGFHWSPSGTNRTWEEGDFDGDHDVDASDLAALGMNWNPSGDAAVFSGPELPEAPLQTVPEPATWAILAAGVATLLRKRRVRP
ncbi:MAG: PEP-CTERM sorting domain-containing protein [Planctomycetes bacterium]|nr:PEP-CTERM sorting domain-containing protein [Planctomycetota bacterium]